MLNESQQKLEDYMGNISERCFCAAWVKNLEYILWDAMLNGERNFGFDKISTLDIDNLKDNVVKIRWFFLL